MNARRTEPSQSLLRGKVYVPAANTDLRRTFAEWRAQQQQPKPVQK